MACWPSCRSVVCCRSIGFYRFLLPFYGQCQGASAIAFVLVLGGQRAVHCRLQLKWCRRRSCSQHSRVYPTYSRRLLGFLFCAGRALQQPLLVAQGSAATL